MRAIGIAELHPLDESQISKWINIREYEVEPYFETSAASRAIYSRAEDSRDRVLWGSSLNIILGGLGTRAKPKPNNRS